MKCNCPLSKSVYNTSCAGCLAGNFPGKLQVFDWLSGISPSINEDFNYIEVRFKDDRKEFYLNSENLPLNIGEAVIVEAALGYDIGTISLTGELVKIQLQKKQTKNDQLKILRKANDKDLSQWKKLRDKEFNIKYESRKIATSLGLQMKICEVEYQGDGSKITFYYTAEGRVDFRQLIKEYASTFRVKIDMRQIGYRQESAKVGGIGSCGRELCCSTWLTDFRSVNTAAARYQQLSINPQKLAGQCGKLKCCLNYELDMYLDSLSEFPSSQEVLLTEKGKAICIKVDVFKKEMCYTYLDNSINWYHIDIIKIKEFIALNKEGKVIPALEDILVKKEFEKSIDIVEENKLNRFEKKKKKKKRKNNKN